MMVTDLRCWWQNHYVRDFVRYVGDFLNVSNRSPTSQTCHQHIWSPTSVTNIDVTIIQNGVPLKVIVFQQFKHEVAIIMYVNYLAQCNIELY